MEQGNHAQDRDRSGMERAPTDCDKLTTRVGVLSTLGAHKTEVMYEPSMENEPESKGRNSF